MLRIAENSAAGDDENMIATKWSAIVRSLVLVRIGQELGTDSQLARAIHDAIDAVLAIVSQ